MQDMSEWELLGDQLEKPRRHVDLCAATQLGRLLSTLHRKTAQENVTAQVWRDLQARFRQEHLKAYAGKHVHTRPFDETDTLNKISTGQLSLYRSHVSEIKALGLDRKLRHLWEKETCFIHGDLHYKAIFVKDSQIALFDFEFAFLGSTAANVSLLLSCYVFLRILDADHTTDLDANPSVADFRKHCLQAIRNMIEAYCENGVVGDDGKFLSDVALFVGATLFFLSVFESLEELMELTDSDRLKIMEAGYQIMIDHDNIATLDQFMDTISV